MVVIRFIVMRASDGHGMDARDNIYLDVELSKLVSTACGINQKARLEMVMLINSGMMDVIIPSNWLVFCLF